MARGIIGTKVGMTQLFDHDGNMIPVTIISAEPNAVIQVKTKAGKDGYNAIKLGYGTIREKLLTRPELGVFKSAGVDPKRTIVEFRVTDAEAAALKAGDSLGVSIFEEGAKVNVTGITKGKGFAGVIKRHGFKGAKEYTHGTHEYRRHGGSIGMGTYPGRVFKGKRMAGHMGHTRVTTKNLRVIAIDTEQNLLVIKGAIPGAARGIVHIHEQPPRAKKKA